MDRTQLPTAHVCSPGAQIVMSANKEAVISEKEMRCGFGQRVLVGYSEVIRSADFPTVHVFTEAVQAEWDRQWRRIYTADWSSARLAPCGGGDCCSARLAVLCEQHRLAKPYVLPGLLLAIFL